MGVAYHGAVLTALADVTGWDPRQADIIVGTSAGSLTGAMLRAGVAADDLSRISEGLPLSPEGARLAEVGKPHRPRPKPSDVLHFRPLADPLGLFHGVVHPRSHPLGGLLAAVLPAGGIPTSAISGGIDAVFEGRWPSAPLWLCAVALRNGRRVVFGHEGGPDVTVGQAVAASCAVPGYFQPVTIGGRRYVDGGMRSLTNTDLVADAGLDLVIVSSPMTQASARPAIAADTLMRQPLRAQLHAEIGALRRAGVPVAVIEPDRQVAQAMGLNPMDARPRGAVSRVAKTATTRWLADRPEGQWLVAMLAVAAASADAYRRPGPGADPVPAAVVGAVNSGAGPATMGADDTLLPSA